MISLGGLLVCVWFVLGGCALCDGSRRRAAPNAREVGWERRASHALFLSLFLSLFFSLSLSLLVVCLPLASLTLRTEDYPSVWLKENALFIGSHSFLSLCFPWMSDAAGGLKSGRQDERVFPLSLPLFPFLSPPARPSRRKKGRLLALLTSLGQAATPSPLSPFFCRCRGCCPPLPSCPPICCSGCARGDGWGSSPKEKWTLMRCRTHCRGPALLDHLMPP